VLHTNSAQLVSELESLGQLESRFSNIKLANLPAGKKRGHFSLVFRAHDDVLDRDVALKFFDQDPKKINPYRLLCFDREHELLSRLVGVNRCLQVSSPLSTYTFHIPSAGGMSYAIPVKYFVTDWYDEEIDGYFLNQEHKEALDKLATFNDIVLAIESLHKRHIFHRDIKADNLRGTVTKGVRELVAIDLGTAASYESASIATAYDGPAGLTTYSAPEAFGGLAGVRSVAHLTDVYALGSLLFELFSPDDFYSAYRVLNPDFDVRLFALVGEVSIATSDADRLVLWNEKSPRLFRGLTPLVLEGSGTTVPLAVADIVNDAIVRMTAPSLSARTAPLELIRRRIWSAIHCLENEAMARRRAAQASARRLATKRSAPRA